jgi:hypothetical protein
MMKPSMRAALLASAVCCLAVLAGVMAVRAFAAAETYCNQCTLGQVPAVSSVRWTYDLNEMGLNTAAYLEIYNYNSNLGIESCEDHSTDRANYIGQECMPTTPKADARCHLLHGDGPYVVNYCRANYGS